MEVSGPALAAAIVASLLLAALAVVQIGVAAGKPWGRLVWGGRHRVLPTRLRVASAVSVVVYAGFAAVLLSRAGALPASGTAFVVVTTWVLVGYFALGIVMNLASRSIAERRTMAPACTVLTAAALVVALAP